MERKAHCRHGCPGGCPLPRPGPSCRGEERPFPIAAWELLPPPANAPGPTLTTPRVPLPGCGRRTLLSPCSIKSGILHLLADKPDVKGGCLESPCPSSAGASSPNAPLLPLRDKRDTGELAAQAQRPAVWRPPPPWQPPESPVPALYSPHLTRSQSCTVPSVPFL